MDTYHIALRARLGRKCWVNYDGQVLAGALVKKKVHPSHVTCTVETLPQAGWGTIQHTVADHSVIWKKPKKEA